nr:hypothetical protein [Tanacetum cinerariifolium]
MKESLSKFMAELAKRHEENSNIIKEIRASTDATIRNQRASIKTLEIQIRQMSKVLQERGVGSLLGSTETNPKDQVKSISTSKAEFFEIRHMEYGPCVILDAYDHNLPQKEKDPGSFTLPCLINNVCFDKALVDLGASMSVMPFSTYTNLGLGILSHTRLTIELADGTIKQPMGIAENVLVRIGKFVFLIDFIILDIPKDDDVLLIIERPFLSTAHSKIDVFKRKITLRAGEEKLVFKSIKPAISIIKRVFMLKNIDLKTELIGEGDESIYPMYGFYHSIIKDKDEVESHARTLVDIPVFVKKNSIITGTIRRILRFGIRRIDPCTVEPVESPFRAWERFKELLMKCPQHYLTDMQEVILFYNGHDVPTRLIQDSKGAIHSKIAADAKVTVKEMAKFSQNGTREHHLSLEMSKVLQEKGFGSLLGSTETNPKDQFKSISTSKSEFYEIHRIEYGPYVVSGPHHRYIFLEIVPFLRRLYNYCCDDLKEARGVKILDAYNHNLPQKEKDLGSFTLPCFINNVCFDKALVDLGASVSVMPFSTYTNLGLGILSHIRLTIELADRTIKQPRGIAENVLVRIGKFVFPIDFIILDIPEDDDVPLIIG